MGAWVFLVEAATIFRAAIAYDDYVIAEQAANRVVGSAALWLLRRSRPQTGDGDAASGVVITDLTAAHGIASCRVACGGLAA